MQHNRKRFESEPHGSHTILFGHGFHPDEPNIRELYDFFDTQAPIAGVDHTIIAPEDWHLNRRLFEGEENLNLISPLESGGTRGQRLLAQYCLLAKTYELTIHPHGTRLANGDSAVYGPDAHLFVKQVANYLGIKKAIIATSGTIQILPNALEIEIGTNSPLLNFTKLYDDIARLATSNIVLPPAPVIDEYIYLGGVTTKTANELDLRDSYGPFESFSKRDVNALARAIGSDTLQLVAYSWDGPSYDSLGYRGEILAQLPLPASYSIPNTGFIL